MWRGNSNITEAIIYLFFFYLLSSTGPRPIDVVSLRYRRKETKEKEKNNDVLKNVCLLSIYPRAPLSLSLSLFSRFQESPHGEVVDYFQRIYNFVISLSLFLSPSTIAPLFLSQSPCTFVSLSPVRPVAGETVRYHVL